jgi:DNA oxidative demethylase
VNGTLFDDDASTPERHELAPGAVHLSHWLDLEQQRWLAARCQEWASGPVPLRAARVRGGVMSVRTVCLGWHWRPYAYSREAVDVNGARVLDLPEWLVRLGRSAVLAATGDEQASTAYAPDAALVNHYDENARMGMHQDRDERAHAPVVSLSIGDTCRFRFGNTTNRGRPYTDVELRSGDLVVFGGPSRLAFHGVTKVLPGTAPQDCGVRDGRINITLRETGLR